MAGLHDKPRFMREQDRYHFIRHREDPPPEPDADCLQSLGEASLSVLSKILGKDEVRQ